MRPCYCSWQISSLGPPSLRLCPVSRLQELVRRGAFVCGRVRPVRRDAVHSKRGAATARPSGAVAAAADTSVHKELPKNFDLASEERLYNWWESKGYFKPNLEKEGKPFVISMPPPNVTGALHMGHAMVVAIEDIMIRHWRMRGRASLWVPGTDHAGIATQLVVEKWLASQGVKRTDLTREEFVNRVWEWKRRYGNTIVDQIRQLGASCDWEKERFTLDSQLSKAVVEAFVTLHERGLIYRGSYMVNWSPNLQTAVSDLEVEYSEEPGTLFYFKYPVADTEDYLPVATTRPETVLGDTAVAVHPLDERYKKYVGKMAEVPMTGGRKIPIIADEHVDREFGTGALKITPGHDPNDYAIGQKFGLPMINLLNKDGTLNENAGQYSGLDRFVARKRLWEDLEEAGLAIKKEARTQRVPRSQRGGEVVEPLVSKQWFVTMETLAQKGLQAVESGDLRIIPERFEKIYNQWLTNIKDWCISRQLWWGHRIPVWYVRGVEETADEPYVVARSEEDAYRKARSIYGNSVKLEQDPDVLDTWFSSGLWPFSTLGWPDTTAEDLQHFYPNTVLETGHDILFFWVARMVMLGMEFTGRSPFSTVYLHGLVRDEQGRKMSKSLGNVVDPVGVIQDVGADALRFTLATGTATGQDLNLSSERLNANKAFTNKLWNAGKFILLNLPPPSDADGWNAVISPEVDDNILRNMPLPERWVMTKLHLLVDAVTASYERFDFGDAGRAIYDFFWSDFADWYIEASKTRLYQKEDASTALATQRTLVYVFDRVLKLLHPFMPFVTEELWQGMPHKGEALIVSTWPERGLPKDMQALRQFEDLQILIRAIRNARAEYSVEPARRITAIVVASSDFYGYLYEEKKVLVALSKLDPATLCVTANMPADTDQAVQLVVTEGLKAYLPLAGLVDIGKEVQRLTKQAAKLQSEYDGNLKRLSSSTFVDKAPADVVQGVRDKATLAEEKLQIIRQRLAHLESMAVSSQS